MSLLILFPIRLFRHLNSCSIFYYHLIFYNFWHVYFLDTNKQKSKINNIPIKSLKIWSALLTMEYTNLTMKINIRNIKIDLRTDTQYAI